MSTPTGNTNLTEEQRKANIARVLNPPPRTPAPEILLVGTDELHKFLVGQFVDQTKANGNYNDDMLPRLEAFATNIIRGEIAAVHNFVGLFEAAVRRDGGQVHLREINFGEPRMPSQFGNGSFRISLENSCSTCSSTALTGDRLNQVLKEKFHTADPGEKPRLIWFESIEVDVPRPQTIEEYEASVAAGKGTLAGQGPAADEQLSGYRSASAKELGLNLV